jgi:hypothetical protein
MAAVTLLLIADHLVRDQPERGSKIVRKTWHRRVRVMVVAFA